MHPFHPRYDLGYQLFSATLGVLFYVLLPTWEGQNCVDCIRSDNSLYFRDLAEKKAVSPSLELVLLQSFSLSPDPWLGGGVIFKSWGHPGLGTAGSSQCEPQILGLLL